MLIMEEVDIILINCFYSIILNIKGDGANFSFRDFEHYFYHQFLLKSQKGCQFWTSQAILSSEMTKMLKIDEILRGKYWKNCRQVKICVQKGDLLGPTPLG